MEKLKMHSPNFVDQNIAKIAELFPNCVTESRNDKGELQKAIDFDLLKQELSAQIVEGPQERYQLNWPGKREALLTANAPIAKTLRPCREESVDFDTTKNLFIEGDNLDALKLLQETYLGKVKMIYIDPPYNTGNDFIYEDDFAEDAEEYKLRSNEKDNEGNKLVANTEANGRFHSDWLTMIYSRLRLAKNLLSNDGVICISISDAELNNLNLVMSEVFGKENYINTISVLAKVSAGASGGGEDKRLKKNIEYIVIYAKSFFEFNTLSHLYTERLLVDVIDEMRDEGESWKYTSILIGADERVFFKTIKDGDGNPIDIYKRSGVKRTTINKVCKEEGVSEKDAYDKYFDAIFSDTNAQTSIRERVISAVGNLNDDEILEVEYVPRSGKDKNQRVKHTYISNTVRRVIWLYDVAEKSKDGIVKKEKLGTLWQNFDYNNVGKEGGIPFPDGKKPIDLLKTCINLYSGSDGIFVDFFSGSSSFPHAVIDRNSIDMGVRKFIAIQYPEVIKENNKKYAGAISFYKEISLPLVITEISKERIRRAGKKIKEENADKEGIENLDIGFRVLKIDTSNMAEVYYNPAAKSQEDLFTQVDNLKPDRTEEDLLFQVMLDWGVDLTLPIRRETIANKTVFFVDKNALVACFDKQGTIDDDFVKELAKHQPVRAVFRDAGFKDDSAKINVEQVFKLLSPITKVKTL
ncbi:site-specific DNA-methyltransferase [Cellvibrio sp.]|uniref:site-specific DNA-methyltransferase n=1 Tax=Cellvibrio sp. TaxID=1965322 RepID=UPI0039648870